MIASEIMGRLGIPHVPYSVIWLDGEPYSVCEDLVTAGTEMIPAWRILKTQKKNNSVSVYQHFVHCCETLGICGTVPFLDRMMVLDYVIANEDRHFNNFGVLRMRRPLSGSALHPSLTAARLLVLIRRRHRWHLKTMLSASLSKAVILSS